MRWSLVVWLLIVTPCLSAKRTKRWLIVPPTAPTRHQLISGIGIPVGTPEAITSGWVMKAQYFLPTSPDDLKPILWESWNDSRRDLHRRSAIPVTRVGNYENYVGDLVDIREEPLPDDEDEFDDGDDDYWIDEEDTHRMLPPADYRGLQQESSSEGQSRWAVYKALESLSKNYGLEGRPCVLRSICEAAEARFTHTGGVFAEMLHIVFSPSTTDEPVSEYEDNEYLRAEQLGRSGVPCGTAYHECTHSLLDIFTGVHSSDTDKMVLRHDEVLQYLMRR